MAATDQTYRNQKALDIVFAVSSTLMLVSIVWMFIQDRSRGWIPEQQTFRKVESARAVHEAIENVPDPKVVKAALKAVESAREDRKGKQKETEQLKAENERRMPKKEVLAQRVGDLNSFISSEKSLYTIAVENTGKTDSPEAQAHKSKVDRYQKELEEAQAEADRVVAEIK